MTSAEAAAVRAAANALLFAQTTVSHPGIKDRQRYTFEEKGQLRCRTEAVVALPRHSPSLNTTFSLPTRALTPARTVTGFWDGKAAYVPPKRTLGKGPGETAA